MYTKTAKRKKPLDENTKKYKDILSVNPNPLVLPPSRTAKRLGPREPGAGSTSSRGHLSLCQTSARPPQIGYDPLNRRPYGPIRAYPTERRAQSIVQGTPSATATTTVTYPPQPTTHHPPSSTTTLPSSTTSHRSPPNHPNLSIRILLMRKC